MWEFFSSLGQESLDFFIWDKIKQIFFFIEVQYIVFTGFRFRVVDQVQFFVINNTYRGKQEIYLGIVFKYQKICNIGEGRERVVK